MLDADIVCRSRIVVASGMAAMLAGPHERVSWVDGDLVIADQPGLPTRHGLALDRLLGVHARACCNCAARRPPPANSPANSA